jgi:hypothetical protein
MAAMGEVGALDRAEVDKAFGRAMAEVDRCLAAGRKRVRQLHGSIEVFLRVDRNGRVASSELRRTTLGDRESADCILEVYGRQQWPRPIGGKFGEIEHSHNFSVADADPPLVWSSAELRAAMAADASSSTEPSASSPFDALTEQLGRCKSEAGLPTLEATFYLDEDGFVATLGLGAGGEKQAAAYDCVATLLKTTSFPSPGHTPAKVTVTAP